MKNFLLFFFSLYAFSYAQNISKAIEYLEKNIKPSSTGKCGTYVGNALISGGFKIRKSNRDAYLFYYDNLLVNAGFKIIGNLNKIPSFLPGDIMVNLNTTLHKNGHICIYNGSKWLSDFAQNTIYTYSNELDIPTLFFRYDEKQKMKRRANSIKCKCYEEDEKFDDPNYDLTNDEECDAVYAEYLTNDACKDLFLAGDEEQLDKCEREYFCGSDENNSGQKISYKYISLIPLIILMIY
jgi:hypothetical protein